MSDWGVVCVSEQRCTVLSRPEEMIASLSRVSLEDGAPVRVVEGGEGGGRVVRVVRVVRVEGRVVGGGRVVRVVRW